MDIGCNTLFPDGPLLAGSRFGLEALGIAVRRLAQAGYSRVEYSHPYHLSLEEAGALQTQAASAGAGAWSIHAEGP